jgi:hypothetical protein
MDLSYRPAMQAAVLGLALDPAAMLSEPARCPRFASEGADGRRVGVADVDLDGEGRLVEQDHALGCLGVRMAHRHSRSRACELVFPDDAFVAVRLAFHPILQNTRRLGKQPDNLEAASRRADLIAIGQQADQLADGKFMSCHSNLLVSRTAASVPSQTLVWTAPSALD